MRIWLSFLLFFLLAVVAHAQLTFQKVYGSSNSEFCNYATQTRDDGFIMVGQSYSLGAGSGDIYVVKTDTAGILQWTKTYGGVNDEAGYYIEQTNDNGFIMTGYTYSYGNGSEDVFMIRTNSVGDTLWAAAFGGPLYDEGRCIKQTTDGGFVMLGTTYSFGQGVADMYLVKMDGGGNITWVKTFGDTLLEEGRYVQQTIDGGYILVGSSSSYGPYSSDVYLVKTDQLGNLQWCYTYGGHNNDYGYCVKQTNDGGFIIVGTTYSFGYGNGDVYLIKTDANGVMTWSRTYGGTNFDDGQSVFQTADGGYLIGGTTENYSGANQYLCAIKTDNVGNLQWTKTFGGSQPNLGSSISFTNDGGFLLGGYTDSYGAGNSDYYLIKTDPWNEDLCSNGDITLYSTFAATNTAFRFTFTHSNTPQNPLGHRVSNFHTNVGTGGTELSICFQLGVNDLKETMKEVTVFPNPCNGQTTLSINSSKNFSSSIHLHLYNILGQEFPLNYYWQDSKTGFLLMVKDVPSGVYFCKVLDGESFLSMSKIIIQR